jgi:type 1 glutamine amidotransferase
MRELVGGKVMPDAVPQFEPMEGREWNSVQKSPEGSPLAWTRNEGDGRVFATVLGRDEEEWKSAPFRALLLAALRWATHDSQTPPTTAK